MTKKQLEIELSNLYNKIKCLEEKLSSKDNEQYLSIKHARIRDYLVRNNFYGKITYSKIKEDFKKEIENELKFDFSSLSNRFINYDFYYERTCLLEKFYEILQKFEYKQIILDAYPMCKK